MPVISTGGVLQVVHRHDYLSSEVQISSGNYYDFQTLSITPKSSSSKLIFMSNPKFYTRSQDRTGSGNSYGDTYIYIQDITNNSQVKSQEWINYHDQQAANQSSASDGLRLQYNVYCEFSNSVTTMRQFRTRAYARVNFGRVGGEGLVSQIIMEVSN
tara:strand:+ start:1125 stop:1595 length:471 start_codon:yes stop_codon:yes gene_type:complete